jgi:hypothetical protein
MQMSAWNAMPTQRLMKVDPMVDAVELHQADEDEIDGDNVGQQSRDEQNEDAGDDGDKRRDMGSGNDHGFLERLRDFGAKGALAQNRHDPGRSRTREHAFGSMQQTRVLQLPLDLGEIGHRAGRFTDLIE